jgi:hypothetical protein
MAAKKNIAAKVDLLSFIYLISLIYFINQSDSKTFSKVQPLLK